MSKANVMAEKKLTRNAAQCADLCEYEEDTPDA